MTGQVQSAAGARPLTPGEKQELRELFGIQPDMVAAASAATASQQASAAAADAAAFAGIKAGDAAVSASAAAASTVAATAKAIEVQASATAAAASAATASAGAATATAKASEASVSATSAVGGAMAAGMKAADAQAAAMAAAGSAVSAATSAATATTKASDAQTSATAAAGSATMATTKATEAAASATAAVGSMVQHVNAADPHPGKYASTAQGAKAESALQPGPQLTAAAVAAATAAGVAVLGAADAAAQREALGLGPVATMSLAQAQSSVSGVMLTTWSNVWMTVNAKDYGDYSVNAPLALTSNDTGSTPGGYSQATVIADGVNVPTFDGVNLADYVNTAGARNLVQLARVGNSVYWAIGSNLGRVLAIPTAPAINTPAVITAASAGGQLAFTAASASGYPAPTVAYSASVNGAIVASGITSGSYTLDAGSAGQAVIVRAVATNALGSATMGSSAVTIAANVAVRAALVAQVTESVGGYGYQYTPTAVGGWSSVVSLVGDLTIPANTDAYFEAKITGWTPGSQQGPFIGVSTAQALTGYAGFHFGGFCAGGGYWKMSQLGTVADGDFVSNGLNNDIMRVGRVGTTLTIKISQDNGATWRVLHSWTGQTTNALYLGINWGNSFVVSARRILGAI
jgi:hypothetical protein